MLNSFGQILSLASSFLFPTSQAPGWNLGCAINLAAGLLAGTLAGVLSTYYVHHRHSSNSSVVCRLGSSGCGRNIITDTRTMRRAVGISSLERTSATSASYDTLSDSLTAATLTNLQSQLSTFQSALKAFALKHGHRIRSDPEFRTAFSSMCAELGVDPLCGGRKGFWDWVGIGDWTFELAVQVVDVCLATRDRNGGLVEIGDLLTSVRGLRKLPNPGDQSGPDSDTKDRKTSSKTKTRLSELLEGEVSEADIGRAIKALEPLGSGYKIISVGQQKFVRSVPAELDSDSVAVFDAILSTSNPTRGFTTHKDLARRTGWSLDRTSDAIEKAMMTDAMLWVDQQALSDDQFYAPALFVFESSVS
ncbi:hypothetical protein CROQUDRAFT_91011 [Cronartium quercuum f. sp. fusiforme G11]|uniref:Vacuolar-sorting protein SNF8 n=1 Tax=Cronartium quercuum f. sp. fusiforme G11 TaxID=708437 RepID=A0A9P6NQU7_9BASI|nr:hypothetical protein CROQUDRAFT_91011 [Cronartium quercuum f. sp. fusiforme G11]